jgi:hypothetical protein
VFGGGVGFGVFDQLVRQFYGNSHGAFPYLGWILQPTDICATRQHFDVT